MLEIWLDYIKSQTFYFVPPESLWPRPDGTIVPVIRLGRVVDEETVIKPISYGYFTAKIMVEEV